MSASRTLLALAAAVGAFVLAQPLVAAGMGAVAGLGAIPAASGARILALVALAVGGYAAVKAFSGVRT